jgi:shikimate dehydrogenase
VSTRQVYLLGHPVRHSVSPAMHAAAFRELGIDARYDLRDVPLDDLGLAIARLREPNVLGANITVPHKQAAMPYLDEIAEAAAEIGAVNTICNRQGRLVGYNTDAPGFLAALAEAGFDPRGATVALLGAGGAARAVAHALAEADAAELFILNRTSDRAVSLAQALVARFGARAYWGLPATRQQLEEWVPRCALVVNCTTLGMHEPVSPLPSSALRPGMLVVDIIYNPPRTRLLAEAEAAGARTQNGLPMLVHQAAAAFALWTGQPAPVETMRAAAQAALAQGV